ARRDLRLLPCLPTRRSSDLAESGGVIVFIDHNLRSVMSLATRVVVLDFGAVIADDMPEKVTRLPEVEAAYQMTTGQPWAKEGQQDRKSTRLNSSHVNSSYAG